MFPNGIIYKYGYPPYGEKQIAASRRVRVLYGALRGIGSGLIAYAVIFLFMTYVPLIREEVLYSLDQKTIPISQSSLVDEAKANSIAEVQEEAKSYGLNSYFSLVIPKIGATSNVVANVDPGDESQYLPALEEGIAHAAGTYFPGQGRRIYLFSHSTDSPLNFARINAVFYLLKKLEPGDRIVVFFADKKYTYVVDKKLVVDSHDTSWISGQGDGEELVLQTCDPPGTTWRRLIVTARPANLDILYGGI